MEKKTTKLTIEIPLELKEKIVEVQKELKAKGITVSLANLITNFLTRNKDNFDFKYEDNK